MRVFAILASVLVVLLALPAPAEAQNAEARRMGAVDIFEGLLSHDAAQRDRAATELPLMTADTARQLGAEIQRADMREGEACLKALANADCAHGALATCVVFDSDELRLRQAALDTLAAMSAGRAFDGAAAAMTEKRLSAVTALIKDSDYMQLQCEGLASEADGSMTLPVEAALRLVVLLDRLLGPRALPLVSRRLADFMLGDQHDDAGLSPTGRAVNERRRRGATLWFQAVWVVDAATRFNYTVNAPWKERNASVTRMRAHIDELEKREVIVGQRKFTGLRLGDHLVELFNSEVSETRAAAYLRLRWWRGDEVVVAGEGYAALVDAVNALRARDRGILRTELRTWWHEYRTRTEPK